MRRVLAYLGGEPGEGVKDEPAPRAWGKDTIRQFTEET